MKAYKLFKLRADGTLGPLFINASQRIPEGVWLKSEDHPTKGFAHRPGWHCTLKPEAPHLKMNSKRIWCEVEVCETKLYNRPESQGGTWVLAEWLKITRRLDHEAS